MTERQLPSILSNWPKFSPGTARVGGDAATISAGDWETLGQNITETVAKQLTHAVVKQLQKGPAFTASNALPGLGLEHLAPLVGLLVAYIASKRRKNSSVSA